VVIETAMASLMITLESWQFDPNRNQFCMGSLVSFPRSNLNTPFRSRDKRIRFDHEATPG
jgi:hypothetical protein